MSENSNSLYVDVAQVPWEQVAPGIEWKVLWQDPERAGVRTVLIKWSAGASVPKHWHPFEEQIYVLEGSISDEHGTCTAGNYTRRPPGCVHSVRSQSGALVFAVLAGAIEPV